MVSRKPTTFWRDQTNPRYERKITIEPPHGSCYSIDPQREIATRTLTWPASRKGCIISLADGFQSAGIEIRMHTNIGGIQKYYPHVKKFGPVPIYWFLGFALGQNRWAHIKRMLALLPPHERFRVYEDSAVEFLYNRPVEQLADLYAPLGLIIK